MLCSILTPSCACCPRLAPRLGPRVLLHWTWSLRTSADEVPRDPWGAHRGLGSYFQLLVTSNDIRIDDAVATTRTSAIVPAENEYGIVQEVHPGNPWTQASTTNPREAWSPCKYLEVA